MKIYFFLIFWLTIWIRIIRTPKMDHQTVFKTKPTFLFLKNKIKKTDKLTKRLLRFWTRLICKMIIIWMWWTGVWKIILWWLLQVQFIFGISIPIRWKNWLSSMITILLRGSPGTSTLKNWLLELSMVMLNIGIPIKKKFWELSMIMKRELERSPP